MKVLYSILLLFFSVSVAGAQSGEAVGPLTDTFEIQLNETLFLERRDDANTALAFTAVPAIRDSSKTIILNLTFNKVMGSTLKISNPFSEQLLYKAALYSFKKNVFAETSTVPVFPGIASYETWPGKVSRLRLSEFRLAGSK